jgi:hypothetical protein
MKRPMRTVGGAAVALTVAAAPAAAKAASAPNIYDNYHSFPVGSRAAGMAGAYTALACDEGATHYNPAALACASDSRLELTANAYVLHSLNIPGAFGVGEDLSTIDYHSLPSIVGAVRVLRHGGEPNAGSKERPGHLAAGFSVSVPNSIALQVDPKDPTRKNFQAFSVRDALTAADIGVGYQVSSLFSAGLALGATVRTMEVHSSLVVARGHQPGSTCTGGQPEVLCDDYISRFDDTTALAVGARAKLGLRLTPTPAWSLGLTITSPSIDVYSKVDVTHTVLFSLPREDGAGNDYGVLPMRLHGSSDVGTPFRIAAGAAYTTPRFTASLDLSINLPREVRVLHDIEVAQIEGAGPVDADSLEDTVEYDAQPNANLGVELVLTPDVVVDLGAFTDISAVPVDEKKSQLDDRIHMFGGSVALGLLGQRARGWFGLSFEYGQGESAVPTTALSLEIATGEDAASGHTTATRWTLVGILGSNYSFLSSD